MLVSIIIPVYNGEKYIREAIDSALAQTYKDVEVIVADDGSEDSSFNIVQEYGKKVRWTHWMENKGTAHALNAGINMAKGEWIKWLSADDVLYTDAIENMMAKITKYPKNDRENSIFYTSYNIIDQNGELIKTFSETFHTEDDLWKAFYGNGSTSLIHRNVFKRCGVFDETLRHSEDYDFWLRATMIYGVRLRVLDLITIKYRRHPDQLTNKVGGSLDKQIKDNIRSRLTTLKH